MICREEAEVDVVREGEDEVFMNFDEEEFVDAFENWSDSDDVSSDY